MESLAVIGLVFGLLAIVTGVLLAGRWIWLKLFPTYGDHFSWLFVALIGALFGSFLFGEFGAFLGALVGGAVGALVDRADRTRKRCASSCKTTSS